MGLFSKFLNDDEKDKEEEAKRRNSKRKVKVKAKSKNCVKNCSAFDPTSGRG